MRLRKSDLRILKQAPDRQEKILRLPGGEKPSPAQDRIRAENRLRVLPAKAQKRLYRADGKAVRHQGKL